MAFQTVFKRYELKYILTAEQKEKVLRRDPHMDGPGAFGRTYIQNIIFEIRNRLPDNYISEASKA